MNIVIEYLKYRFSAKGRHGVHSPFVYSLSDKTLKNKVSKKDNTTIANYIKSLQNNKETIKITDYGAGSKTLGDIRSISGIYKNAASKKNYGQFLYQLSRDFEPGKILELGTSLGVGSLHFTLGNPKANITTIEGCKATYEFTQKKFKEENLEQIKIVNSKFDAFIQSDDTVYDMIFIDGHHDGKALLNYLNILEKNAHDETIFILDDIRWSDDMFEAWNSIINNERFHLTIDFFRMGLITKRHHQFKEHFILKK